MSSGSAAWQDMWSCVFLLLMNSHRVRISCQICVWVLGMLATFGNILVIAWRIHFKHTHQVTEYLLSALKRVQLEYAGTITKSTYSFALYILHIKIFIRDIQNLFMTL
jgi:hypothetical protein